MTTLYKVCVDYSAENCKKLYNFLKSVGCILHDTVYTDLENTTLYDYTQNWDVDDNYCCILVKDNVKFIYYGFVSYIPATSYGPYDIKTCNVNDFINLFKRRVEL